MQVRYAWSNTAQPSLRNEYGLPSSCFLIDMVFDENEVDAIIDVKPSESE